MKLSIVIPAFNAEGNIQKLLSDITNSRSDDYEVLIINDGSTDRTEDISRAIISASKQVRLFNIPNGGAAKARTHGLLHSVGEYVFFCDSDDRLGIDSVDKIIEHLNGIDMLFFSSVKHSVVGDLLSYKIKIDTPNVYKTGVKYFNEAIKTGYFTSAVWTYVFKNSLVAKYGASFTDRIAHEDHLFTLKLLFASKNVAVIPDILYKQILVEGSLTRSEKSYSYIMERYYAYKESYIFINDTLDREQANAYSIWSMSAFIKLVLQNFNQFRSATRLSKLLLLILVEIRPVWGFISLKIKNILQKNNFQ